MVGLTPLAWIVWFLATMPKFWAVATLAFPMLMTMALSVAADLQLGPAWCRGAFLAKLGLRAFAVLHPLIFLIEVLQLNSSSPEAIAENASFFLEMRVGFAVSFGILVGVLPASQGTRYFHIGLNSACLAGKYLYNMWDHVDCGVLVLLAPPLICALCGHLSHITVSAALRHTAAREEAMSDFVRLLDSSTAVKDTAAATRQWVRGPLTTIYQWCILAGLIIHAGDVATSCWAHGCYAVDEPSILCVRYVVVVLALVLTWQLLTHWLLDVETTHELCRIVAKAHTYYVVAFLAGTLYETLLGGASEAAAKCEDTLSGVPAPLEGPMGRFAVWELHKLIRVFRNLVLSFLATAQPTTELHRGLNVALTIACVVLSSELDASSWADVRFITAYHPRL